MLLNEILDKDFSAEYVTMLRVYADNEYSTEFVRHMMDAAIMSHYKYGWVADKPSSHYKTLAQLESTAFDNDNNLEHMVNIANYAMFRYMTNKGDEDPRKLIDIGIEAMKCYNHPMNNASYTPTDSDKSVHQQRVNDHLRDLLLSGPYEYINTEPVLHFDYYE